MTELIGQFEVRLAVSSNKATIEFISELVQQTKKFSEAAKRFMRLFLARNNDYYGGDGGATDDNDSECCLNHNIDHIRGRSGNANNHSLFRPEASLTVHKHGNSNSNGKSNSSGVNKPVSRENIGARANDNRTKTDQNKLSSGIRTAPNIIQAPQQNSRETQAVEGRSRTSDSGNDQT